MMDKKPLVEVKNLSKIFRLNRHEQLYAVDDVSFDIFPGEVLGLVGESGCGKTTTGRCIVRLNAPTKGQILYKGKDIFKLNAQENQDYYKEVQMIFQNPYSSLNPRMTVFDILSEGLIKHTKLSKEETKEEIYRLLQLVGLNKDHINRFPHEFSGGQRQRIGIARALSVNPKFIVCDEPISALDVSIQAQVINLLVEFQEKLGLTFLMIAHDLSMIKYISDRIIVMYLGSLAEYASAEELTENPLHPYTVALLSAIPVPDPKLQASRHRIILKGDVPSPVNVKQNCKFADRCPKTMEICKLEKPVMKEIKPGHFVACHLY